MNMTENILVVFAVLSLINVIGSTVRSILTVGDGVLKPALANSAYFAFYNLMVIYTVADFPFIYKTLITFGCNFFGVAIVKLIEKKMRKDKLWKVEMTVHSNFTEKLHADLKMLNIPHNFSAISDRHTAFNVYCKSQKESLLIKDFVKKYNAKYFVSETKIL